MKQYRLLKDLPTFKAGDLFSLSSDGCLYLIKTSVKVDQGTVVMAYHKNTLKKFPNLLKEWFVEVKTRPNSVDDLEDGDECWIIAYCAGDCHPSKIMGGFGDHLKNAIATGSLFLTKEDAEREIAHMRAKTILKRDTKGFKPDFTNFTQKKWYVYFDYAQDRLDYYYTDERANSIIYFASKNDAIQSIKKHAPEWLIYLGVYMEEED